jgi:hypothetical protein
MCGYIALTRAAVRCGISFSQTVKRNRRMMMHARHSVLLVFTVHTALGVQFKLYCMIDLFQN